jgi:hypothetical protein
LFLCSIFYLLRFPGHLSVYLLSYLHFPLFSSRQNLPASSTLPHLNLAYLLLLYITYYYLICYTILYYFILFYTIIYYCLICSRIWLFLLVNSAQMYSSFLIPSLCFPLKPFLFNYFIRSLILFVFNLLPLTSSILPLNNILPSDFSP